MYAIFETGGKQYRVKEGDEFLIEKLEKEAGDKVEFETILVCGEGSDVKVGTPTVDGAKIEASVIENGKAPKVIIYKYKSKKDYRKKKGHRQPFTKIKIDKISM